MILVCLVVAFIQLTKFITRECMGIRFLFYIIFDRIRLLNFPKSVVVAAASSESLAFSDFSCHENVSRLGLICRNAHGRM